MLKVCPNCDTKGLEIVTKSETFDIRGESITTDINLYHCNNCGKHFSVGKELGDPLKKAFKEYRNKKGMIQPEEIIAFRKKYDLTQKELSVLLGFGEITLSRYENGSLQDQAHDNILKLALDPVNLSSLLEKNKELFTKEKYQEVSSKLSSDISSSFVEIKKKLSATPNEFNGFNSLNFEKIAEVIRYICFNREIFKTKLLKLLFYSDFLHYKIHKKSITGLEYVKLPFGPVPDQYELILVELKNRYPDIKYDFIETDKYSGELIKTSPPGKQNDLSETEIEAISKVSQIFINMSSKKISEYSHKELSYLNTQPQQKISYSLAETISIYKAE